MKKKKLLSIFLIFTLSIFLIFTLSKRQKIMSVEPTLDFKIVPSNDEKIDKSIQINIRKIRNIKNYNDNKIITLLKDGVIYPLKIDKDFPMYELFIKTDNKYGYISSENVYFINDISSIRGSSGRKGKIFINPKIEDNHIIIEYHQYYNNTETKYSKIIKLSDDNVYINHFFKKQIDIIDFNEFNVK
jgi:hypothetical protein